MATTWCVALHEVRHGDLPRVGGKASNLGELIGAGFDVPEGFVVTTDAFGLTVGEASSRSGIEALDISSDLETSIRRAYSELGEGLVAVRSSATAEDLPGAAFAGQQDTYLNVVGGDDVIAAVRDCWASLFSERAIAYRQRLRIDPPSIAMGVVVQRMVEADVAGVMFTADPVTGARDRVVINASRGLGEAVVSGTVTPDHFVVGSGHDVIERRCAGARPDWHPQPVLEDSAVVELAMTGRRIAAHFGRPQDIEWALLDGCLVVLQSRAMTALPPAPIPLTRLQRAYGPMLMEMLPRRPLPMELTAAIQPIVGKHVMDMASALAGIAVDFTTILPALDRVVQEFRPPQPRLTRHTPARLVSTVLRGLTGSPGRWREDPRFLEYAHGVAELNRVDPEDRSWENLLDVPQRAGRLVELMTQVRVAHLPSALVALAKLRLVSALSRRRPTIHHVLDATRTVTRTANDELAALASDAAEIPDVKALVVAGDVDQLATASRDTPVMAQWWRRFQQFLTTYGHREVTSILLLHDPAWGDSPHTVLGLVRMLLDGAEDSPPVAAADAPGPALPRRQRSMVRRAAAAIALREDTHFELSRIMPPTRRAIMEMGRRLARDGALEDAEDVWMLTLEEVAAHVRNGGTDALRAIADRRGAAYSELAPSPLIATTTLYPRRRASTSALVVGTPSGGGSATGRVRIIGSPDEFGELRAGEVLVCSATNPSWTPLFQRAAAVVVDHGGVASHAAIVAREYGIPAVMGAATATTTLRDGQLVTVDGDAGEVTAVEAGR